MRGAFIKGVSAFFSGANESECPYDDIRKPSGKLSWSRAFINSWLDGFEYAKNNRDDALITLAHLPRKP